MSVFILLWKRFLCCALRRGIGENRKEKCVEGEILRSKIWRFQKNPVILHSQIGRKPIHRGVEQLVARQAHNLEVARSSRVSATLFNNTLVR